MMMMIIIIYYELGVNATISLGGWIIHNIFKLVQFVTQIVIGLLVTVMVKWMKHVQSSPLNLPIPVALADQIIYYYCYFSEEY